jgi:hypothetical protein
VSDTDLMHQTRRRKSSDYPPVIVEPALILQDLLGAK